MNFPLIQEIPYQNPLEIFAKFASVTGSIFLDSSQYSKNLGRYSFIVIDPFQTLISKDGRVQLDTEYLSASPFDTLQNQLKQWQLENHADLPPFQGGAVGYFSYDLCRYLEKIPAHKLNDQNLPDMLIGFYDLVISFDQYQQKAWIISCGFPEQEITAREMRAKQRYQWLIQQLNQSAVLYPASSKIADENIENNFNQEAYQNLVTQALDYIYAGDIYQVNLARRFSTQLTMPGFQLYQKLRQINGAPFSAYINGGSITIASASPERFLKLANQQVETRPIKGTRPRGTTEQEDQRLANELLASKKDCAENLMIVDLLRNDLSRVCQYRSVQVHQFCQLESYASVHHLVSTVVGKLKNNLDAVDLIKSCFPGGSVTGAPKIRAMEIIAELETHARGPYCGSIGYIGFDGNMDSSIIIRSFVMHEDKVSFHAGGAIVADSDPEQEHQETLIKAKSLREALTL